MGASTRSVIASTKLAVPRPRRALVARPDLCARLDADDYRLALVNAPAGYGKTSILASWAGAHPGNVAWLSCDSFDVEPSRFMAGLLTAIGSRWPGVADDALILLDREGADTVDAAIALANGLEGVPWPAAIVIDDVHLARPSPQLLRAFVEAVPDHVRLVFGSRSDLPIPRARLRVGGGLLELRSDDLRFTPAQTAEFVRVHGLMLDDGELRRLHELTEGWPAGAQLAVLALERGADRHRFFDAMAMTDRAVSDFLLNEVLESLPQDFTDFLVDTSVLETFDADLCAELTGREDAGVLLERFVAADLFVVPLDHECRWYRYHHLFGAFLRARLALRGPAHAAATRDRAGRILEARGDFVGALRQAIASADSQRASAVIRAASDRNMLTADSEITAAAIRSWLREHGERTIESDPGQVVELAIALSSAVGAADDVASWISRVEHRHPDADPELTSLIHGAWNDIHFARGETAAGISRGRLSIAAVGGCPPNRGLLPLAPMTAARSCIQAGDFDGARVALDTAVVRPSGHAVADRVRIPSWRALVFAADGELDSAFRLASTIIAAADDLGLARHDPGRAVAALARVEVHLERLEQDAASSELQRLTEDFEPTWRAGFQSLIDFGHARYARFMGDQPAAESALLRSQLALLAPDHAALQVFAEERFRQALRFGTANSDAFELLDELRPQSAALQARWLLAAGRQREARTLVEQLVAPTTRRARVEHGVIAALAVLDVDVERANELAVAALAEAAPERLMWTILDAGPNVHQLLLSCTVGADLEPFVTELISASSRTIAPLRHHPQATGLVETLSARELTVLRYLGSRLTYDEIASALYVSLNTLKSHVKSVYRKLAVASRADAVRVGRELGLI